MLRSGVIVTRSRGPQRYPDRPVASSIRVLCETTSNASDDGPSDGVCDADLASRVFLEYGTVFDDGRSAPAATWQAPPAAREQRESKGSVSFLSGLHGTVASLILSAMLFADEIGLPIPFAPNEVLLIISSSLAC